MPLERKIERKILCTKFHHLYIKIISGKIRVFFCLNKFKETNGISYLNRIISRYPVSLNKSNSGLKQG